MTLLHRRRAEILMAETLNLYVGGELSPVRNLLSLKVLNNILTKLVKWEKIFHLVPELCVFVDLFIFITCP